MNTVNEPIEPQMEVRSSDGLHVGTVDHLEGESMIKLTRTDKAAGGEHHYIPMEWVDHVDAHVHLSKTVEDVRAQWQS
ncbi:MAG: hypothetical protein K0R10_1238 [Alphaproteobacteria bacterium]|jgi:hypothetical protein|nr:hypothetical protein [Alphaproteobacteria bacterium]